MGNLGVYIGHTNTRRSDIPPNSVAERAMVFPIFGSTSGHRERRRVTRLPGRPRGRRRMRRDRHAPGRSFCSELCGWPSHRTRGTRRSSCPRVPGCLRPPNAAGRRLSPRPVEWRARHGIPRRCSGRCAHGRSGLQPPTRRRGRAVVCSRPRSQIPRRLTN